MIKWFAYIVMLLIFAPCLSSAGTVYCRFYKVSGTFQAVLFVKENLTDTTLSSKSSSKIQTNEFYLWCIQFVINVINNYLDFLIIAGK